MLLCMRRYSVVDVIDVLKDADVKEVADVGSKNDEGDGMLKNVHVDDGDAECVCAAAEILLLEDVMVEDDGFVQ